MNESCAWHIFDLLTSSWFLALVSRRLRGVAPSPCLQHVVTSQQHDVHRGSAIQRAAACSHSQHHVPGLRTKQLEPAVPSPAARPSNERAAPAKESQIVYRKLDIVLGYREGLAHVPGFKFGQRLRTTFYAIGQLQQGPGTSGRDRLGPAGEPIQSRLHRSIHILHGGPRHANGARSSDDMASLTNGPGVFTEVIGSLNNYGKRKNILRLSDIVGKAADSSTSYGSLPMIPRSSYPWDTHIKGQ